MGDLEHLPLVCLEWETFNFFSKSLWRSESSSGQPLFDYSWKLLEIEDIGTGTLTSIKDFGRLFDFAFNIETVDMIFL